MILRRMDEGALKCALRALRREVETSANDDDEYRYVAFRSRPRSIRAVPLPSSVSSDKETGVSHRKVGGHDESIE